MRKTIMTIVAAAVLTAGSVALASDSGVSTVLPEEQITMKQAKEIALQEVDGKITSAELDEDDGELYYDIDIDDGTTEYEFEIDALTGEITDFEKEEQKSSNKEEVNKEVFELTPAEQNKTTEANNEAKDKNKTNEPTTSRLTSDEAIAIAKQHATGSVTEVKRDDDVFEIEMEDGDIEYEIEIDMYSGEIVSFEKDLD